MSDTQTRTFVSLLTAAAVFVCVYLLFPTSAILCHIELGRISRTSSTTTKCPYESQDMLVVACCAPISSRFFLVLLVLLHTVSAHNAAHSTTTTRGHTLPYNILVVLPAKESNNDKFGLTIERARPVIDIAVEDVVKSGRMPPGWVNLTFWDDRYWEDTNLAERYATVGMVKAYCEHRLDAILGFADSYGLATVTKVSAGLNGGVPVLTTAGMPSVLNMKKSYPFLTRMQGSYRQLAVSMYQLIAYQDPTETSTPRNISSISLNYLKMMFFYHDKKRAVNKPLKDGDGQDSDVSSSHCYFSLYAIKNYFTENSKVFKREWQLNTPSFPFDEELPRTRDTTKQWLSEVSMETNGEFP